MKPYGDYAQLLKSPCLTSEPSWDQGRSGEGSDVPQAIVGVVSRDSGTRSLYALERAARGGPRFHVRFRERSISSTLVCSSNSLDAQVWEGRPLGSTWSSARLVLANAFYPAMVRLRAWCRLHVTLRPRLPTSGDGKPGNRGNGVPVFVRRWPVGTLRFQLGRNRGQRASRLARMPYAET